MTFHDFCSLNILPPFYSSTSLPCASGALSFGLNFSFAVVVSLFCLVSLIDQIKKILQFADSESSSLTKFRGFLAASDSDERCKLIFSLLLTLLSLLYIISQWAFQLANFWLDSCVIDESLFFWAVGPCRWTNSLLYCLNSLALVSLLLLFNLFWYWQYNRSRKAVRPFRFVLYEWGVLSMVFALLLLLDLLLQVTFENCLFFWRISTYLVLLAQVALTLSFSVGWVFFIRRFPKIGVSEQARRASKAFFIQTSIAMFLFTYQALFNLITTVIPYYFPFNCFWSIFLIVQSVVVITLPLLILIYSVTPAHSLLFYPCRRFGYTHQSEFPTNREATQLLQPADDLSNYLELDHSDTDSDPSDH